MPDKRNVFERIKKQNGESFAKTIRSYDNGIFDIPNIEEIVRYAGRDAEPLLRYLISLKNITIEETLEAKDPFELLASVGYHAEYADSLEKQNSISQYFAPGEKLCTFRDSTRYKRYYILNVVSERVLEISRADFSNPEREDEYGTSVMSIQILKDGGFISIKNRYNHIVPNCDNTLDSNPDNIVPGLSLALKKYFNVDFSSRAEPLPDGCISVNGKILKYNFELNNVYFGEDFYSRDGEIHEIDKDKEIMLDYFILDLQNRKVSNPSHTEDFFVQILEEVIRNKKLAVRRNKDKSKSILADDEEILRTRNGEITYVSFPQIIHLGDNFLRHNSAATTISLPDLEYIGDDCFRQNRKATTINLPALRTMGNSCFRENGIATTINLSALRIMGNYCFHSNYAATKINFPALETMGEGCFHHNKGATEIDLPALETMGGYCFHYNMDATQINLPALRAMGDACFEINRVFAEIKLPNLETMGGDFSHHNKGMETNIKRHRGPNKGTWHNLA